MAVEHTTDQSFEDDVLKSSKPVIVDFWAEWCGPCKMMAPALDQLAEAMGDKAKVLKINIDDNPNTPGVYGVRGIPTLMLFQDGEIKATKVGALPQSKLLEWVEQSIS